LKLIPETISRTQSRDHFRVVALYDTIQELFNFAAFFPEDFHDLFSGQVLVKKLLSSQL